MADIIRDSCTNDEIKQIEKSASAFSEKQHRRDNLVMLVYITLLILSVLTIWTLKHKRLRYFHSTGLSIIYGLIIGACLAYGFTPEKLTFSVYDAQNSSCNKPAPMQKMVLKIDAENGKTNKSLPLFYLYSFDRLTKSTDIADDTATFNPEIFFNVILPPIIFAAGYSMKRRHFFRNFGAIMTYAFLGTLMSAFIIAAICFGFTRMMPQIKDQLLFSDCVLFGAMISATDPVTVLAIFNELHVDLDLYALVFGESVLNDAVAISMAQSVEKFSEVHTLAWSPLISATGHFFAMFACSFGIGVFIGILTSLITKFTHIRDFPLLETTLFVLMSYTTFLLAEVIGYTGIIAVLFCGITQAHYTFNNLSRESKVWTKQFFELLNFLAENFIFAYIGVSTFTFRDHTWHIGFVFITLIACFIARAVQVYGLTAMINCIRHYQSLCVFGYNYKAYGFKSCKGSNGVTTNYANWSNESGIDDTAAAADVGDTQPIVESVDPSNHIAYNKQHMLLFCGLRGAMAFSLAIRNTATPIRQMFFSTTIVLVMLTVFICGCLSTPVLQLLKIRVGVETNEEDDFRPEDTSLSAQRMAARENKCSRERTSCWLMWSSFDSKFMKPLLTHSVPTLMDTSPGCCVRFARLFTTAEQMAASKQSRMGQQQGSSGGDQFNASGNPNKQPSEGSFTDEIHAMHGQVPKSNKDVLTFEQRIHFDSFSNSITGEQEET